MRSEIKKFWLHPAPFAVAVLALVLRFYFTWNLPDRVIWSDEEKNLLLAENWSSGKGYVLENGQPTAIIPLGFPLLLGALRWLGLSSLSQIRMVQTLISLLTLLVAGELARRYFGRRTGWLTMALFACYPYFIYLPGTVLATVFYCLLVLIGLLLWDQGSRSNNIKMLFLSGLVWGFSTLTVSTAILLVAALWVWQVGYIRRQPRAAAMRAALFFLGFSLIVLPWVLRNHARLGVWNVATNGGYNLWLGNNPGSRINNPSTQPTPDSLQQRLLLAGDEAAQDVIFSQEAGRYIRREPAAFIQRTALKALYFWRLDPSPVTSSYAGGRRIVRMLGWLSFLPLLLLAAWGYRCARGEQRRQMNLWIIMALIYTLFHALMIVKVRFRLPIDQLLIMAAAFGLVQLLQKIISTKTIISAGRERKMRESS